MKIVAVTQARMNSQRLPGKILLEVTGKSLLQIHLNRICKSKMIDKLIVATTTSESDDVTVDRIIKFGNEYYRGSEFDVLDRYYQTLNFINPQYVVRLTSDCPLIDANLIDKVIEYCLKDDLDYCSNNMNPSYPDGQDVEVFKFSALAHAWEHATLRSEREHVTPYIWKNSNYNGGKIFSAANFNEGLDYSNIRMTVDEKEDYELIKVLIEELGDNQPWLTYAKYILNDNSLLKLNDKYKRNEGYRKSINED